MICLIFMMLAPFHLFVNGDRYIEKQNGQNNLLAELEDISFLVFYGETSGDYDYSYDYSDLTVKPETNSESTTQNNPTTENLSTSSVVPDHSTTENLSTSSVVPDHSTTEKLATSSAVPEGLIKPNHTMEHPLNTENFQIPVVVVTEGTKVKKGYVSSSTLRKKQQPPVETATLPKRTCLNGFVLDEKNRCKKKINARSPKPPLPGGLRYPQRPQQLTETK